MEEEFKPKSKKKKILFIIFGITLVIIIGFFAVTGAMYLTGENSAGTNIINNPMSTNAHRMSFTNLSNDEVAYVDNQGYIQGKGNATFIGGYFTYLGSVASRITSGWFTNLDATNINSTITNATTFYEGGNRLALNSTLGQYTPNTTTGIQLLINSTGVYSTYNATYAGLIDNASYLSTYNATYAGLINNASYLSTYNSTYAGTTSAWDGNYTALIGSVNNASYLSTYNATYAANIANNSWNESYAHTLFDTTYNATYAGTTSAWNGNATALLGCVNNASYLSTYNATYAAQTGNISGAGTQGYIPQFQSAGVINNSVIYQLGGNVGIGTTAPSSLLDIKGPAGDTGAALTINASLGSGQAEINLIAGTSSVSRASRIDFINTVNSSTVPRWTILNDWAQDATNDLSIADASTNRVFTILQGGSVGIGTTAPTAGYEFHVKATASNNVDVKMESGGGTVGTMGVVNGGRTYIQGSTGNGITLLNGNVGIEETTPTVGLQIKSDTNDGQQVIIERASNTNEQLLIGFHSSDYGSIQALEQTVNFRPLALQPLGSNVGIGTTAPVTLLANNETAMTDGGTGGSTRSLTWGTHAAGYVAGFTNGLASASANGILVKTAGTGSTVTVANFMAGSSNILTVKGDNVGIGTTAPAEKLDVAGNISSSGKLFLNITDTTTLAYNLKLDNHDTSYSKNAIEFWSTTSGITTYNSGRIESLLLGTTYADAAIILKTPVGAADWQSTLVARDNKVGIATENPLYPLHVATNTSSANQSVSIFASGNISALGYITRTTVYDKSRGSALDKIKDAEEYKNPDGTINHKAFYGYAGEMDDIDYSKPESKEECSTNDIGEEICKTITTYPETKKVEGVLLDAQVAMQEQAIYELKEENKLMKESLCKLGETQWC